MRRIPVTNELHDTFFVVQFIVHGFFYEKNIDQGEEMA
jgi:hypothetical protein